jgi:hypothetical protein
MISPLFFIIWISFIGVEIIGVIIYAVVKSDWLAKKFANRLDLAWVFVDLGSHDEPVKGNLIHASGTAYTYAYRFEGLYHEVTCPRDYPIKYFKRCRKIYADISKTVALSFPAGDQSIHKFSEEQFSSHHLEWSHVEMIKTIKKQAVGIPMTLLIIIAIIILATGGGIWWYTNHNKKPAVQAPAVTTTAPYIITTPYVSSK